MICPTCGKDNAPDASFCGRCGTQLDRIVAPAGPPVAPVVTPMGAPSPGAAAGGWPAPPSPDQPQISHRGRSFGVGFGPTYFAIWPLGGGPPVATFARDQEGWTAAWRRFQQLEADAAIPAWRQRKVGWILLNVVISFALWFVLLVLDGIFLTVFGRDTSDITDTATIGATLALPAALAAWLLFAYLGTRRSRWLALVAFGGGALVLAVALGIAGQPAA